MFTLVCQCGQAVEVGQARLNEPVQCAECGREILAATAQPLDDAAAAEDFAASLLVVAGPTRETQLIFLGGSEPITIGASAANTLVFDGDDIAPHHCRFTRDTAAPSGWHIEDAGDTTSVFVNNEKTKSTALQQGDTIQIGDYELRFEATEAANAKVRAAMSAVPAAARNEKPRVAVAPSVAVAAGHSDGPICPSCGQHLARGAKVCIDCGIRVPSGRPLLFSRGLDENTVHGNAETAVRLASWIFWITPLPVPLASEADGKFRPYTVWLIALLTLGLSLWCLAASDRQIPQSLMLWPLHPNVPKIVETEMRQRERLHQTGDRIANLLADAQYSDEKARAELEKEIRRHPFQPWQLVTHPFIHDPQALGTFVLYLGGNLLFLIVFGSRVNAVIGNRATAILYPLLAIISGLVFLLTQPGDQWSHLSGASGAVSGLAGIYLVLFPAHKVYCGIWGRFLTHFWMKVFALRGVWVLLIYLAFTLAMAFLGSGQRNIYWVELGGFSAGVAAGFALLLSRRFDCRNGDLPSLLLGRFAWPMIGKPPTRTLAASST